MRNPLLAIHLFVAACGAPSQPVTAVKASSTLAAELPAWMEGAWATANGSGVEHWHVAGGALFGVGFPAQGLPFEAMIISVTAEGKLRLTAFPAGDGGIAFEETERGETRLAFANPAHDFPKEIGYERKGDMLVAFVGPGGGQRAEEFTWLRADVPAAPELEQADRDFAAATAKSQSAGWAAWFDAEGAQWRERRVEGPDAVREMMHGVFDVGGLRLEWTARASGLAPAGGRLGFTIGDYVATSKDGKVSTGGYVTVWRQQGDGRWKVLFDTGT